MDIALGLGLIGNITSKETKKEPVITDKIRNMPIMETVRPTSHFAGKRPVSGLSVGTN